jgi:hypothetical protein
MRVTSNDGMITLPTLFSAGSLTAKWLLHGTRLQDYKPAAFDFNLLIKEDVKLRRVNLVYGRHLQSHSLPKGRWDTCGEDASRHVLVVVPSKSGGGCPRPLLPSSGDFNLC